MEFALPLESGMVLLEKEVDEDEFAAVVRDSLADCYFRVCLFPTRWRTHQAPSCILATLLTATTTKSDVIMFNHHISIGSPRSSVDFACKTLTIGLSKVMMPSS
jgi:hypothetical protein